MDTKQVEAPVVVPDGVEYVEPEVRDLAAGIAADIRKYGHWQDGNDSLVGGVCIVLAPTFKAVNSSSDPQSRLDRLTFLLCGVEFTDDEMYAPTDVVLARLDAIAEGLVEL